MNDYRNEGSEERNESVQKGQLFTLALFGSSTGSAPEVAKSGDAKNTRVALSERRKCATYLRF